MLALLRISHSVYNPPSVFRTAGEKTRSGVVVGGVCGGMIKKAEVDENGNILLPVVNYLAYHFDSFLAITKCDKSSASQANRFVGIILRSQNVVSFHLSLAHLKTLSTPLFAVSPEYQSCRTPFPCFTFICSFFGAGCLANSYRFWLFMHVIDNSSHSDLNFTDS